jgi:hypothetical protein
MPRLLSEATIDAIAALGISGLAFEEDVKPALVAAGLPAIQAEASFRSNSVAVAYYFPITRDHIRRSLDALDLADPEVVQRVLQFTTRITEVCAASTTTDPANIVRLRHALADDGYQLTETAHNGGNVSNVRVDAAAISRIVKGVQAEFDKHSINIPLTADGSTISSAVGNTTNYYGPVIHGNADGAQLAWSSNSVQQTQNSTQQVAAGFESVAQAVVSTLEGLPAIGLADDERQDAEAAAKEILAEITRPEPDQGKVRRALTALKGALAPIAAGLVAGSAAGAQEWARTAVEQLRMPF